MCKKSIIASSTLFLVASILFLALLCPAGYATNINFTAPTLRNASNNVALSNNINISTDLPQTLIYEYDYTNFTVYNEQTLLRINFDNLTALGENENTIYDWSSYSRNVSFSNSKSITGIFGNARNNSWFMPLNTSLANTSFPQSYGYIDFWIRANFSNFSANQGFIFDSYDASRNHFFIRAYAKSVGSIGTRLQVTPQCGDYPYCGVVNGTVDDALTDNAWNHLTVVYNISARRIITYINGKMVINTTWTNTTFNVDKQKVNFFRTSSQPNNATYILWSQIDEISIGNRTLSSDEVLYRHYMAISRTQEGYAVYTLGNIFNGTGIHTVRLFTNDTNGASNSTLSRSFNVNCFVPYQGINFTSGSILFCPNLTLILNSSKSFYGAFMLNKTNSNNTLIDGNNAIILFPNHAGYNNDTGGFYSLANYNVYGDSLTNNITLRNLVIRDYYYDFAIQGFMNGLVENIDARNARDHNIIVYDFWNLTLNRIFTQNSSHTSMYVYGNEVPNKSNYFTIQGSFFNGSADNQCLHMNIKAGDRYDLSRGYGYRVINNTFSGCPTAEDASGTRGLLIENNTYYNATTGLVRIWNDDSICNPTNCSAKETIIKNNLFYTGVQWTFQIWNYSKNTSIYNNTYNNTVVISIVDETQSGESLNFNENTPQFVLMRYDYSDRVKDAKIYWNYSGVKRFSLENATVNLQMSSPYTYVWDVSNNTLLFNGTKYNLSLVANTRYEVTNGTYNSTLKYDGIYRGINDTGIFASYEFTSDYRDTYFAYNATGIDTRIGDGKIGNGSSYNTSNSSYVNTTISSTLLYGKNWSIKAWYYLQKNSRFDANAIVCSDGGGSDRWYFAAMNATGYFRLGFGNDSITLSTAYALDTWHQAVYVYNGSGVLYVDGNLAHNSPVVVLGYPNKSINIGRCTDTGNYAFNGSIDEVTFALRAWTADEVTTLYANESNYTKPTQIVSVSLDFNKVNKTSNFTFGTQNDYGNKRLENQSIMALVANVSGTNGRFRIWVQHFDSGSSTSNLIPLLSNGSYDYKNLTLVLRYVLNHSLSPTLQFLPPRSFYSDPNATYSGASHPPPNDTNAFGNYTANVVAYYYADCLDGYLNYEGGGIDYNAPCIFNDWYFTPDNEPGDNYINITMYAAIYNASYRAIKNAVPSAKMQLVGGFGYNPNVNSSYFSQYRGLWQNLTPGISAEAVSIHDYDILYLVGNTTTLDAVMNYTEWRYYQLPNLWAAMNRDYNRNITLYNDEWSMSWTYNPTTKYTNNREGAVWMASALRWMMLSDLNGENQFIASEYTTNVSSFGLFNQSGEKKPSYMVKEQYAQRFTPGSNIYAGSSNDTSVEILATDSNLVLINKFNQTSNVTLTFSNKNVTNITDQNGAVTQVISNSVLISMPPYNFTFYKMETNGTTSPCIYSGSGEWIINGTNNCNIGPANLKNNTLKIISPGLIVATDYLINISRLEVYNVHFRVQGTEVKIRG